MQVTANLYDWEWVKSARDFDYFFNVLLTSDEEKDKSISYYEVIDKWADSHNMWCEAWMILEWIESHTDNTTADLIRKGIYPLVSENSFIDELHYGEASGGPYYATLSPTTVHHVAEAFNALNLPALCTLLTEKGPSDIFHRYSIKDTEEFIKYLQQWLQLLNIARDRGMGIIGHIG